MADTPQHFRFLDLPGELRNRIYDIATEANAVPLLIHHCSRHSGASSASEERPCDPEHRRYLSLRYAGLTQVNRQVRSEYLPNYSQTLRLRICFQDLPAFCRTFYPTQDGEVKNAKLLPRSLEIFVDELWRSDAKSTLAIDILPLLQIKATNPSFRCGFIPCESPRPRPTATGQPQPEEVYALDEVVALGKLLRHRRSRWLNDITTGQFRNLWFCRFTLKAGRPQLNVCLGRSSTITDPSTYAKDVGLLEMADELDYDVKVFVTAK